MKWKSRLPKQTYRKALATWVDETMQKGQGGLKNTIDNMGDKMLREMFPDPKHLQDIKDIGRIDDIIAKSQGSNSVLAPLLEASAIAGVAGSPVRAVQSGAATILTGLPITGALLTNKKSAQWLAKGMRNPRKLQFFMAKATAELVRHSKAMSREIGRQQGAKAELKKFEEAGGFTVR